MIERDPLAELLSGLEDPDLQNALSKMIELLKNLERSGLLDMMIALTEPEVVNRIMDMVITTGTLKLGDSVDTLLDMLGKLADALVKEPEPMGLSQVLASLKDPEVAKGLARLVAILKILGK